MKYLPASILTDCCTKAEFHQHVPVSCVNVRHLELFGRVRRFILQMQNLCQSSPANPARCPRTLSFFRFFNFCFVFNAPTVKRARAHTDAVLSVSHVFIYCQSYCFSPSYAVTVVGLFIMTKLHCELSFYFFVPCLFLSCLSSPPDSTACG